MKKPPPLLYKQLTNSRIEYIAHSVLGEAKASIAFAGQLEGQSVIWHATLIALKAGGAESVIQYIDVTGQHNSDGYAVEIGLPVYAIDEPTVLKSITMIRQYKKLHQGRHEFQGILKQ